NLPRFLFDSRAGAIGVSNPSTGSYIVTFGNLSRINGGMVQVTPFDDKGTCAVQIWGPGSGNLTVFVDCYSLAGVPQEAKFDLIVTQPVSPPPGTFDYAHVYLINTSGPLAGPYVFNSAHKRTTVRHLGTGRYQVTFGGPASTGTHGTVKVSASGAGGGDCAA